MAEILVRNLNIVAQSPHLIQRVVCSAARFTHNGVDIESALQPECAVPICAEVGLSRLASFCILWRWTYVALPARVFPASRCQPIFELGFRGSGVDEGSHFCVRVVTCCFLSVSFFASKPE
jgi:hypothetical protein